jgi:hypothetical protein
MKQLIKSIKLAKDLKQAGTSFVGAINRSREKNSTFNLKKNAWENVYDCKILQR